MKIIWITTQFPSSATDIKGSFIYRTVKELSNIYDITVFCLYPIMPPLLPMLKDCRNAMIIWKTWREKFPLKPIAPVGINAKIEYIKYLRLPRGFFHHFEGRFAYLAIKKKLKDTIRDNSIIHATWLFPEGDLANIISKKYKIPFLVTLMGSDVNLLKKNSQKWFRAKEIIGNSSLITSVSAALYNTLKEKNVEVPETKRRITHTLYEFDKFTIENKNEFKEQLGFSNQTKIIFYAGTLRKLKNVDVLIKAFSSVLNEDKNLMLLIAGRGEEEGRLLNQVKNLKIEYKVKFLGGLNGQQIANYYNAADVFCLPSKSEGTPNVVIESLLCGTPVVASSVGEIPYIVKDGKNGYTVEPGSVTSLSNNLRKALSKEWDRDALRASVAHLSPDAVIKEYCSVYNSISNQ